MKMLSLYFFPSSLKDKARSWINILPANNITSREQTVTKFLNKYFLVHRSYSTGKPQSLLREKMSSSSKHKSDSTGYC